MVLKRLHHGGNDKYFLLADSAWRSLARFGVSILVAKLAGADVFGLLVILLAIEVIVTTLLSAWQLMPAINTGPGAGSVERDQLGRHIIIGSLRWASLISVAGALLWGLMGFAGAGVGVGLGFVAMVWVACLLQAVRAWRSICFESWHVFWADLVALGVPLLAIWLTFRVDGPDSLLASGAWASALSGLLAGALMLGRRGWVADLDRQPDGRSGRRPDHRFGGRAVGDTAAGRRLGVDAGPGGVRDPAAHRNG